MTPQQTQVLAFISSSFHRGQIFFQEDLEVLPIDTRSIRNVLSDLNEKSLIVRLFRGAYLWPVLAEGTMKFILPEPDEVAHAVALRKHIKIIPSGPEAAWRLGLTPLRTAPWTYYTTGARQTLHLANGVTIRFLCKGAMTDFSFENDLMRDLVVGLKEIGRDEAGEETVKVAWEVASQVGREAILRDIKKCPGWIREILWGIL